MAQEHRALKSLGATLPAVALSACGAFAHRPEPPATPEAAPPAPPASSPALPPPPAPAPRPTPPPRQNHLSPATSALVNQAHSLAAHGDLDGAASTLDRALRIEPNNPLIWIEIGRTRLAENAAHQAETCARKALNLGTGDRAAQAQAGRVLADALRAQGRNPEASEVERQPYMR